MIYVKRGDQGNITEIELTPSSNNEEVSLNNVELINFIKNSPNREELTKSILDVLDLDMVRVIEDLIDIMIDRELIRFTDLPIPVQNKLVFKRKIRNLTQENTLFQEEELLNL